MSPTRTPATAPAASNSGAAAAKPGSTSTPSRFGVLRQQRQQLAQRDDEIAVVAQLRRQWQGQGTARGEQPEFVARHRLADGGRVAAPLGPQRIQRHRVPSPRPTANARRSWRPFPARTRVRAGSSCFSRMAAARPAGPPPTTSTSYSSESRSIMGAQSREPTQCQARSGSVRFADARQNRLPRGAARWPRRSLAVEAGAGSTGASSIWMRPGRRE